MIERAKHLAGVARLLRSFPVVGLIGARQVGKTTLAHALAREFEGPVTHLDLERPRDLARLADPELALDFGRVVHGSQEYEIFRPLRIGETFAVDARIASIREKGDTAFLTIETRMRATDGSVAAVAWSSMIEREPIA